MSTKLSKVLHQLFLACLLSILFTSCKNEANKERADTAPPVAENNADDLFFKISLAQWSLSKPTLQGDMDPLDFAQKANEMGFEGIEYVSGLYNPWLEKNGKTPEAMQTLLDTLKKR